MKRVRNGKTIGAFIAASFSIVLLFANGSTFAQSSDGGTVSTVMLRESGVASQPTELQARISIV